MTVNLICTTAFARAVHSNGEFPCDLEYGRPREYHRAMGPGTARKNNEPTPENVSQALGDVVTETARVLNALSSGQPLDVTLKLGNAIAAIDHLRGLVTVLSHELANPSPQVTAALGDLPGPDNEHRAAVQTMAPSQFIRDFYGRDHLVRTLQSRNITTGKELLDRSPDELLTLLSGSQIGFAKIHKLRVELLRQGLLLRTDTPAQIEEDRFSRDCMDPNAMRDAVRSNRQIAFTPKDLKDWSKFSLESPTSNEVGIYCNMLGRWGLIKRVGEKNRLTALTELGREAKEKEASGIKLFVSRRNAR